MDKQKKFQFSIKRIYGAIFTIAMIMAAALLASKAIYKTRNSISLISQIHLTPALMENT